LEGSFGKMMNYLLYAGLAYMLVQRRDLVAKVLPQSMLDKIALFVADKRLLVIRLQTAVLMATVAYMVSVPLDYVPYIGGWGLQNYAYRIALWTALGCSGLTLVTNYDMPPVKEGWAACQPYLAQVSQSTEFHFFFYSCVWMNAPPFFLVLLVPGRRALWSVMTYMAKVAASGGMPQWETIRPQWEAIKSQEKDILVYSSMVEISLGFYLLAMLIIEQDISRLMTIFIYWSFLRIRYHAPRSKVTHEPAWTRIGELAGPVKDLPGIKNAVEMGKAQFLKPM
jgi:hypothetical protein